LLPKYPDRSFFLYLAQVIGTVVATVKSPGLEGEKLLVVVALDKDGRRKGDPHVACDVAQAGPGDRVYCVSAREASHALKEPFAPVDAAIVGIVDTVDREPIR
jgi:ethanolamine utilization protein EutN